MTPMTIRFSLSAAMHMMRAVFPPQLVIHVGAGDGLGDIHLWRSWDINDALIVDADQQRLKWAKLAAQTHAGWKVTASVVAQDDAELAYHTASNPDEDGILDPDVLNPLWPNLRTVSTAHRQANTLDSLVASHFPGSTGAWLLIDCHPADRILAGATSAMDAVNVLVVRCLRDSAAGTESLGFTALNEALAGNFSQVAYIESNHPAVGHALYVRNVNALLQSQAAMLTGKRNVLEGELRQCLAEANLELERAQGHGEDQKVRLTVLERERDDATALLAARTLEIEQLLQTVEREAAQRQNLKLRLEQVIAHNMQQEQALTQQRATEAQLEDTVAEQAYNLKKIVSEKAQLVEQAHAFEEKITQLGRETAQQTERERKLAARTAQLESDAAHLGDERDKMAELAATRKARIGEMAEQAEAHAALQIALQERVDQLTAQGKQHDKTVAQQRQIIFELEAAAEEHSVRLAELTQEVELQLEQARLTSVENDRLSEAAREYESQLAAIVEEKREATNVSRGRKERISELAQQLADQSKNHEERIKQLAVQSAERGEAATSMRATISRLEKEANELAQQLSAAVAEKQTLVVLASTRHEQLLHMAKAAEDHHAQRSAIEARSEQLSAHNVERERFAMEQRDLIFRLQQDVEKHEQQERELSIVIEQLQAERQELTRHTSESAQAMAALAEANEGYTLQLQESENLRAQLTAQQEARERDAEAQQRQQQELEARLNQMLAQRSEQERAAAQRHQTIIEQAEAHSKQAEQLQARIDKLTAELENQSKRAAEQLEQYTRDLSRMQNLEAENQEARMRQQIMQDELIKGEAQIALIKDLLLRESGV